MACTKWLRELVLAAIGCVVVGAAPSGCADDDGQRRNASKASDAGSMTAESAAPLLSPPEPGRGVQFTMTTGVDVGQEVERCQFVRTGDSDLLANHDQIRFMAGSHHALLYLTSYKDRPTQDEQGAEVDTSGVFECSQGVQGFWAVTSLMAAAQSPDGPPTLSFPEGVALRIPANSWLLMNTHYINTTASALRPTVYINLHTIPEAELQQEGGLIFWDNPFLKVPAKQAVSVRASCPLPTSIHITNVQSHMHRRGVGYAAVLISPEGTREEIYRSHTWEDVPVGIFTPNLDVSVGSRIEWQCDYENSETRDIYRGPRSSDEMCIMIGSYYPRDDRTGFCERNNTAFSAAQWHVGRGDASCADSLQCVLAANAAHNQAMGSAMSQVDPALFNSIADCLAASRPELSAVVSDLLGCMASAPSLTAAATTCTAEIAACQAQ